MKPGSMTDREFEEYLLSFRPIAPKPLRLSARKIVPFWRVAAVVALLIIGATLLMRAPFGRPSPDGVSYQPASAARLDSEKAALRLNRAAAASDAALESALTREFKALPRTDKRNSALSVLAQDHDF